MLISSKTYNNLNLSFFSKKLKSSFFFIIENNFFSTFEKSNSISSHLIKKSTLKSLKFLKKVFNSIKFPLNLHIFSSIKNFDTFIFYSALENNYLIIRYKNTILRQLKYSKEFFNIILLISKLKIFIRRETSFFYLKIHSKKSV
jgi:hypothetical protein